MRHIGDVSRGMGNPQPRGVPDPYAGGIMTKHGWLSYEDLGEVDARVTRDVNGNRVVQFPVRYEKRGGQRVPIYRDISDEKLEEGKAINAANE